MSADATEDDGLMGEDLEALRGAIPLLSRARRFAEALDHVRLFERLGEPLSVAERAAARAYLDGLGFPDAEPAPLMTWDDAADAAEVLDVDPAGWQAEEQLRAALNDAVLAHMDETGLTAALALVAEKAGLAGQSAAAHAGAIGDVRDEALLNAAVGGAVQAANGAALALMAAETDEDASDHPFMARFRLYAYGRWPIGLAGLTLNIL